MNNKDKLTNATMQELQANIDEEIDIDEDNNSQLKKIVESYVKDDNLEEFGKVNSKWERRKNNKIFLYIVIVI